MSSLILTPDEGFLVVGVIDIPYPQLKADLQYFPDPASQVLTVRVSIHWKLSVQRLPPDLSGIGTILLQIDILNAITEYLDLRAVQRLKATSKKLRSMLLDAASFRVRRVLAPYFPSALAELGSCLQSTGAIIGGSTALHIIRPAHEWSPGDLDIVVPRRSAHALITFLESEGYHRFQNHERDPVYTPALGSSAPFDLQSFYSFDGLKIDLSIVDPTRRVTPLQFILSYHCTPLSIACLIIALTICSLTSLWRHELRHLKRRILPLP